MNSNAMYKLSYGLFILTAREGDKDNGCIINTAVQSALTPNQLSISVNKATYTHDMIMRTGVFNVSIISEKADFELYKHFGFSSGKEVDKFKHFSQCNRGANGVLYVTRGTNAYISVKVSNILDLGSHTLFVGEVTDMDILDDANSVTYDYYLNNIKPKPQAEKSAANGQTVWRCIVCGYEYVGEELPEDFICPLCKHPASDFEKITK